MEISGISNSSVKIDVCRQRYPYCIVWTPLPFLTALFPFIGHSGICTSEGVIHDFSGPYMVTVDDMAFGDPTKYVPILDAPTSWDKAVNKGDKKYRREVHNLFYNNCHSHVAYVLNACDYRGGKWNMFSVWWLLILRSRYTGVWGFFTTFIEFFILVSIIYFFICLTNP